MRGDAENAGVENAAPDCRGGKRGSLKSMESEDFKNVFDWAYRVETDSNVTAEQRWAE